MFIDVNDSFMTATMQTTLFSIQSNCWWTHPVAYVYIRVGQINNEQLRNSFTVWKERFILTWEGEQFIQNHLITIIHKGGKCEISHSSRAQQPTFFPRNMASEKIVCWINFLTCKAKRPVSYF